MNEPFSWDYFSQAHAVFQLLSRCCALEASVTISLFIFEAWISPPKADVWKTLLWSTFYALSTKILSWFGYCSWSLCCCESNQKLLVDACHTLALLPATFFQAFLFQTHTKSHSSRWSCFSYLLNVWSKQKSCWHKILNLFSIILKAFFSYVL